MKPAAAALIAAGAGALALLAARQVQAAPAADGADTADPSRWSLADYFGAATAGIAPSPDTSSAAAQNLAAFLMTIRRYESSTDARAYSMLYGRTQWTGPTTAHPAELGWAGVKLPADMCRRAGFSAGCVSTAAGAYQIIKPTWQRIARKLGLADFSARSQDLAAIGLLDESGALDAVRAGRFDLALGKVAHLWASMPGNTRGQASTSLAQWRVTYQQQGGRLA